MDAEAEAQFIHIQLNGGNKQRISLAKRPGETVKALSKRLEERLGISADKQLLSRCEVQLVPEERDAKTGECVRDPLWEEYKLPEDVSDVSQDIAFSLTNYTSLGTGKVARIPNTALRAITVTQLSRLHAFVKNLRDDSGTVTEWYDCRDATPLKYESMSLYHLADWVIRPATFHHRCSLVELMAEKEQPPKWFASHWWGEAITRFLSCLLEHCDLRSMSTETTAYWICAFANNQHELGAEIVTDPTKTSFFRAMQASRGVLCILDEEGSVFSRSWCSFETASAMKQSRILLDIATAEEWTEQHLHHSTGRRDPELHKAVIITEGLTREELQANKDNPGAGATLKAKREKHFPLELISKGLHIDVKSSRASMEVDRRRILNALAERPENELDSKPLDEHENYERVNTRLRSVFALAGWSKAAQSKPELLESFSKTVQADTDREIVSLSVANCHGFNDDRLLEVAKSLHEGLDAVELNMYLCKDVTNAGLMSLADRLPAKLQTLDLSMNFIRTIGDDGVVAIADKLPGTLRNLFLAASGTNITNASLEALARNLPEELRTLQLHFSRCKSISDIGAKKLMEALPAENLRSLTVRFEGCPNIYRDTLVALMNRLPRLEDLRELDTNFFHTKVSDQDIVWLHSWRPAEAAIPMRLQETKDLALKVGSQKVAEHLVQEVKRLDSSPLRSDSSPMEGYPSRNPSGAFGIGRSGTNLSVGAVSRLSSSDQMTMARNRGKQQSTANAQAEVMQIFKQFDTDGSGTISKEELGAVLKSIDCNFTEEQISSTFADVDVNIDGQIDYEEFIAWIFE